MSMIERVKREVAYVFLQIFCSYFEACFETLLKLFYCFSAITLK